MYRVQVQGASCGEFLCFGSRADALKYGRRIVEWLKVLGYATQYDCLSVDLSTTLYGHQFVKHVQRRPNATIHHGGHQTRIVGLSAVHIWLDDLGENNG